MVRYESLPLKISYKGVLFFKVRLSEEGRKDQLIAYKNKKNNYILIHSIDVLSLEDLKEEIDNSENIIVIE